MGWTVAPALKKLIDETNAKWPNRSKASDGTIGDKAHKARKSEHNPDDKGRVLAADITLDGVDREMWLDAVIGDPRVHYVINERRIYSRTYNWVSRPYNGPNPHRGYAHVSLRNKLSENSSEAVVAKSANDVSPWLPAGDGRPATPKSGTLKRGSKGAKVKTLQQGLNRIFPSYRNVVAPKGKLLVVDGVFGSHTERWVQEFQKRISIKADGIVGSATKAQLAKFGIKV